METITKFASRFLTISEEHWEYLFEQVPQLRDMERYLHDHDTKRRLLALIGNTPLHGRAEPFKELMQVVREESYQLQLQEPTLHKACKSAHAVAETARFHKLHIIMSNMDCDAFWREWTENMESQELFFDRAGDNIWLESARMEILQDLIEKEHVLLRPLVNLRKAARMEAKLLARAPPVETKRAKNEESAPPVEVPAKPLPPPKNAEEKWQRFHDVNAKNACRCPGSLYIECTPDEALLFRQFAQEIRDRTLPEENIKGRFLELLAKVENAS